MIERLKKLTLLIYESSKEIFFKHLQELGLVHLEINYNCSNEIINQLKDNLTRLRKTEKNLKSFEYKDNKFEDKYDKDIYDLLNNIDEEYEKLSKLIQQKESLKKEIEILKPFGSFSPDIIKNLNENGIYIKFYTISKNKFNDIDKNLYIVEKISEIKNEIYFVLFYQNEQDVTSFSVHFHSAQEIKLNIENLDKLQLHYEEILEKIEKQKNLLAQFNKYIKIIKKEIDQNENLLLYYLANSSIETKIENAIVSITGWIPEQNINEIIKFLDKEDVVYILEDPKKDDNVPIKLKNNKFNRLFEPIGKLFSLPSYNELDPTPFFAPFFSLFFGLCIGDLGYGLVMLIISIIAYFLIKNNSIKPFILLGIILSCFSIFSGIILNTFFGEQILNLKFIPQQIKKFILFSDMNSSMLFAISLGVVQVIFGYILQVINKIKARGLIAGLQPLGISLLLIGAIFAGITRGIKGDLSIGPIPVKKIITSIPVSFEIGLVLIIIGVILILLFNNIDKAIFVRPLIGLWELYGIVTGIPGDILSYIRLFALGLAGSLLGNAFNKIGLMILGNSPNFLNYFFMILLLVVGHTLNLGLAGLSAFVHPLRLTLLEFYKSIGFSGGGKEFTPFKYN